MIQDVSVRDLVFTKALFWVQVHNILVRFMNTKEAKDICDIVGTMQKSTKAVDDEGGYFIQVRFSINITLPLCRGRVIAMDNREKHWVNFKYERLPNFCF